MFNFEVCAYLAKAKESENFNHPSTICRTYGTSRNILNISSPAEKRDEI
ncbi:MAG: hypothetical protein ISS59_03225 [Desulfobacteraceae bacterium]|nr:hypothetical protein [Desulfobacteraceae bacterium]